MDFKLMKNIDIRYIALLSLFLLVATVPFTKISDYDLFWHLKLGESVFNSGHIYAVDEFSYTFGGQPQFNGEWLADLLIYLFCRVGGFQSLNILKIILLLVAFFLLYKTLRIMGEDEEAGFTASVITLALVLCSMRFRLFIRPYLFSFVFFAATLYLLSRYDRDNRNNGGGVGALWFLPLVELAWANISKTAIFGPLLFLLFIVSCAVRTKRLDPRLLLVMAVLILASLCNPVAYGLYGLAGLYATSETKNVIGEMQPLSFQILWGYGIKYTVFYQLLVVLSLIYLVFFRGWKNLFHLSLFVIFFGQSVRMVRMIDFFSLAAAPLVFTPVMRFVKAPVISRISGRRGVMTAILSLTILALIPVVLSWGGVYTFGAGVKEDMFPEGALAFLDREKITGKLFNSYPLGGYIIWRSPERKVFVDGRGGLFYPVRFMDDYFEMLQDEKEWKASEEKWGFDYALLDYDMMGRRFPQHITQNPDWALVYWDNHSAVYLKRSPENQRTITKYEYLIARPNFYDFSYLNNYEGDQVKRALDGLRHDIALNPANQEPLLAKAFLLYKLGPRYHEEIWRDLMTALKLKPDLAMEHAALAQILMEYGQIGKARDEVAKALALDPADPGAVFLGEKLGFKVKKQEAFHH